MRPSRSQIVFGLLAAALVVTTALIVGPTAASLPELSVRSVAPNGARALWLWLEALGYRVEEINEDPYGVDPGVAALFIMQPTTGFNSGAIDAVVSWVEQGGQLVVVSDSAPRRLLERFDLAVELGGSRQAEAWPVQPLLGRPPVGRVRVESWERIDASEGLAPWLAADSRVFLGSRPHGSGRVIVLAALGPLSNAGLADPEHAALVLNLVGGLPAGARVAFDEYHHGFVQRGTQSLWSLLWQHAWGWAILYALALGYLYLILRGRRFGRPLPVPVASRRSLREYVVSLATLYRRARQRAYAADQVAERLKRDLATALGLSPQLADAAFAATVAARRGGDPAELNRVLERLRAGGQLSEGQLLALVREADAVKAGVLGRTSGGR
jgi:hypothetical protein